MKLSQPAGLRLLLLVSALALGIVAQVLIGEGYWQWSLTPLAVAVGATALAAANRPLPAAGPDLAGGSPKSCPPWTPPGSAAGPLARGTVWLRRIDVERRWGLIGLAVSGAALTLALQQFAGEPPNTLAWYSFALSIVLLLPAVAAVEGRWTSFVHRLRRPAAPSVQLPSALVLAALLAILGLGLGLRLYQLDTLPAGLWYDEADNLVQARSIQQDPGSTPVFVPSTNLPSLFLMPIAAVVDVSGVSITTGRVVSVAFGVLGIVATFLLARLMLGPLMGLVAALLVAVMRWDINWSRIGMHGITAPLLAALVAYLLLRAFRSGLRSDFAYAGAALGLAMWLYTALRLFPLVVAFMLLHHLVVDRPPLRRYLVGLLVMAVAGLAVAAPVIQSAIVDSDEFFDRTRTTSVFAVTSSGEAAGEIWRSLGKHVLMFNEEGDLNPRHNLPGEPMLDFLSGALMLLGLGVAVTRWRNVALATLPVWMLVMVLPGVLTLPWEAPQSLRAVGTIPAVVLSVTLALWAAWTTGRAAPWQTVRRATPAALLLVLGVITYLNVNTYFGEQARHPEVYAAFTTDETIMARDMVEQQRRGFTLFVSRQFKHSLTRSLLADDPRIEVIRAPTGIPIDPARVWRGAAVYLEPREGGFFELLRTYYPDGRFREVRPPGGGRVLYYLAEIPREALESRQGLSVRYTISGGVVREFTQGSTAGVWLPDVGPEDVPFDLVWEGAVHVVEPGEYSLMLDGTVDAEVMLDGRTILGDVRSVRIEPAVGLHSFKVTGRVEDRAGYLSVLWQPPGGDLTPIPPGRLYHGSVRSVGLSGRFYESGRAAGLPDATRVTPTLELFQYDPAVPEPYLAVWDGRLVVPTSGDYRIRVQGAGTISLSLDGELLVSQPGQGSIGPGSTVRLTSGSHSLRLEYASESPPSQFSVLWVPPGGPLQPVPIEYLVPDPLHLFRVVDGE